MLNLSQTLWEARINCLKTDPVQINQKIIHNQSKRAFMAFMRKKLKFA